MAIIDIAGYVANLKEHSIDHGFHVHDERHYIETYSLRQTWEVDLHPDDSCGGPLDIHLTITADPRTMLALEDVVMSSPEGDLPPDEFWIPLEFSFSLPPLGSPPDLLQLSAALAPLGDTELPVSVSAIDSLPSPTDAAQRHLTLLARTELSLRSLLDGEDAMCGVFDRCAKIAQHLLSNADAWLMQEADDAS